MTEIGYRLKEFALLIPRNIGKIVGGLIGMFALRSTIAFFVLLIFGHEFDRVFSKGFQSKTAAIDNLSPKKRIKFIRVFYNVMGHIAKADGRVNKEEIDIAQGLMEELKLNKDEKELAIRSFNDGKNPEFPLAATLQSFYKDFRTFINLREWFLRLQIQAALAGDGLSRVIVNLLNATAAQLDIPGSRLSELLREAKIYNSFTSYGRKKSTQGNYFQREKQRSKYSRYSNEYDDIFSRQRKTNYGSTNNKRTHRPVTPRATDKLAEAYILLGVSAADDSKHITRAYRRLLSQNHPDKVIGQGAGKAERELANAKTIEIRQAYELIKERKNF